MRPIRPRKPKTGGNCVAFITLIHAEGAAAFKNVNANSDFSNADKRTNSMRSSIAPHFLTKAQSITFDITSAWGHTLGTESCRSVPPEHESCLRRAVPVATEGSHAS
jgi:hypothetical protein